MIRVSVAGPENMLRTGLETLVRAQPDMDLISVADSISEVADSDVLIALGFDLESLDGLLPGAVVLIWPQVEVSALRSALKAGVRGVLPQDCTSAELTATIQAAAAGLTVLRSSDIELLSFPAPEPVRAVSGKVAISPRELEVLRLLADGLANKEIGYRLGISEHTVKFHVNSILTRLDASSRAEAVAIGMRQGLILL
ncbi:MAG: response regulator transcription factor [Bryobacteraceae bacterium]|nr:response regulator transcription factor [Bryobacteraceae bacterium]